MIRSVAVITVLVILCAIPSHLCGQISATDKPQHYMYTLQVIPSLLDLKNWTEKENKIVSEHFQRLKRYHEEGIVILAGRVPVMDPEAFGIVIFRAATEEDALAMMENDPAVSNGIMTAELYPFSIALIQPFERDSAEND